MKILMTGITQAHCNTSTRRRVDYLNVPRGIKEALEASGHVVEWRKPTIAENQGVDAVWMNVGPVSSVNSVYAPEAIWTMGWAYRYDVPLVLFYDDWQIGLTQSSLRTFRNIGTRQLTKTLSGRYLYKGDVPTAVAHSDEIMAVLDRYNDIGGEFWKRSVVLLPKFERWGDLSIVTKDRRNPQDPMTIDLSAVAIDQADVQNTPYANIQQVQRRWFLASLFPHSDWVAKQGFGWPLDFFGPAKKEHKAAGIKTTILKGEPLVFHEGQKRWGTVAPGYPQSGSGWFRARFLYAALGGTVLYCDRKDAEALDGPFEWIPASKIEAMDDYRLADLAMERGEYFMSLVAPRPEQFRARIDEVLSEAVRRAR